MNLYFSNKIEIRKSPVHGWGVFAKDIIFENEILEESPFAILPISPGESSPVLNDYRFNYPCGVGDNWKYQVAVFGFASIYNHSDAPNAMWYTDEEKEIFVFKTIKRINKDDEIFVYYGGSSYWEDGRKHVNVI